MSSRNFSLRLSLFNAVLFLGSGIQLPFLPLWLKDKGLTDPQVALIVAMTMAVRIIAIPMGTFAADLTQRRRPVIIACAIGTFLAYTLLHFMSGFWPILIATMLAAALLAPVVPLSEVLAVEGSARFGLDYGRIRLWASLSFLTGSVVAGALLEVIPVGSVILLIAGAQGLGALFALIVAIALFVMMARMLKGFELQVLGAAPRAGRFAGFSGPKAVMFCFLLSGALAGLAGASDVMGSSGQLQTPYSPNYGFVAIIVAFLGRLNPLGVIIAGLLLALSFIGGESVQVSLGISDKIAKVFQGILLFFLLACDTLILYRVRFETARAAAARAAG